MFKKIGLRLALQFTAFVFLLFLVNGAMFLAADFSNARYRMPSRLERAAHFLRQAPLLPPTFIPPHLRDRIRLIDPSGHVVYSGSFFAEIPFSREEEFSHVLIGEEQYGVLTLPILKDGHVRAYAQIADIERAQAGELPSRGILYLLVSILVSLLTFLLGRIFARTSLQPAEQAMRRLEQFTQDASHELRTPLAALNSSLDLALKTEKYREGILSAKEDVRHITTLVERLLELARLDAFALKKEHINLSVLTEQALERHRVLALQKRCEIRGAIAEGVMVEGDAALLPQVVGNLLANAIKFNRPGGTITVTLTPETLSVADTGIGIAAKDLPSIFHRFFQADSSRARGGYGLGLALAQRIVQLHGWSIRVESVEGKGTLFTIVFAKGKHS